MSWAQDYAALNRDFMLHIVMKALRETFGREVGSSEKAVNCHHNYAAIEEHFNRLMECRLCPAMGSAPVSGRPVLSRVMLVGQAPGNREPVMKRPFAWTAGKTLFRWFHERCGLAEEHFRSTVYLAAVCAVRFVLTGFFPFAALVAGGAVNWRTAPATWFFKIIASSIDLARAFSSADIADTASN